jgi:putative flavoprotein involved in K+ transport
MSEIGFGDRTVDKLPSPQDKFAGSAHGTGKDGGHTINLHQFAKDGVVLLGRIQSVAGDQIIFSPDLKENLAKADKFEAFMVNEIDKFIEETGLDSPVDPLIELRDGYNSPEILELDLVSADIRYVIWATGFKFDFGLVQFPAFDEDGYPIQKRGVSEFPGLYFIGLPFLHTSKSGLLAGVGDDAAHVVEQIAARR